ncbi:hypothetical protein ACFVU2_17625 [Leifsonia sp. NPDC058194]|uniref:hypothetical protein n=1 Tax=Leifsonia sp. NPDC058194 TaxID=3346374 RepID=UPI0036DE8253
MPTMDKTMRRLVAVVMLGTTAILVAAVVFFTAPAAALAHTLSVRSPTELCEEQGQPAGFHPPHQTRAEAVGRVVLDPLSVHCYYDDWLGAGPTVTVARGWPPSMALLALFGLGGAVLSGWVAIVALRRAAR